MPKGPLQFDDAGALKGARRFVGEWEKRVGAVREQLTYQAAKELEEEVRRRMPGGGAWRRYRQSLQTVKVTGTGPRESAYAVRVNPKARAVKRMDAPRTVLYVRPKGRFPRPEIAVLAEFSPWTLDTIPFTPSPASAVLISRRVRMDEVIEVARLRREEQSEWRKRLELAGYQAPRKKLLTVSRRLKAIPDVAFEAIRLEFGLGGGRLQSHWRPALRSIVSRGIVGIIRREKLGRALRSGFLGWKKWKPRPKHRISSREAQRFGGFVKRLGVRVKR
jgi:hypothetical protein